MQMLDMRCPACGGIIKQNFTSRMVTCEYCGSRYLLDDGEAGVVLGDGAAAYEEEEASSLSMTDFAAEACADFLARFDNGSFRSTPKILRGLGIADGEDVYLIHDDTFMKSGKNGFAITEQGLYCRDLGEEATFIDWATFARMDQPEEDGCHIKSRARYLCYFTDDNDLMPEFLDLYLKLYRHAKYRA